MYRAALLTASGFVGAVAKKAIHLVKEMSPFSVKKGPQASGVGGGWVCNNNMKISEIS